MQANKIQTIEIQTMEEALTKLASLYRKGDEVVIEDCYCSLCTIRSKLATIRNPRSGPDEPRALIVGVGGVYKINEVGIPEGIYRVAGAPWQE